MSVQFFYDGQGKVVDEYGVEPMDLVVDQELFALETISSHTQFLENKHTEKASIPEIFPDEKATISEIAHKGESSKRDYTYYTDQEKGRFFQLKIGKCLSASTAAKQLGIHVRTAQRWAKQYEDPDSIFEKDKKKPGRRRILKDEHKQFLLKYIDENLSAVLIEVVESLIQNFEGLEVSRSTVYNFMTTQCNLSIKQAQFYPVERNSEEKVQQLY